MNVLVDWHKALLLGVIIIIRCQRLKAIYIYGLKSLAPISGLTPLLALALRACLHRKKTVLL